MNRSIRRTPHYLACFAICLGLSFATTALASAKQTVGVNETITILPENIRLQAKLDTGADTSSLDARNIEFFTKDNQEWVRFKITRAIDHKPHSFEYPILRNAKITSRVPSESIPGKTHQKRPVIKMDICIGDQHKTIEVNLFDRSNFKYPFLLGASGLTEFDYLVDVQSNHVLPNKCTVSTAE